MVSTGNNFPLQTLYVVTWANIKLKSRNLNFGFTPLTPQSRVQLLYPQDYYSLFH